MCAEKNSQSSFKNVFTKFFAGYERQARRIAAWLSDKTKSLSTSQKKWSLFFFCLLCGSASVVVAVRSFRSKVFQKTVTLIKPVPVPKHIGNPGKEVIAAPAIIEKDRADLLRLLDSVKQIQNQLPPIKK